MTREEAIKNIKKVLPMSKTLEDAFYTLHPELYESEDERIRKAIIELLKEVGRDDTGISENAKCMIAYLEKLGEQKPVSYTPLCNTIKDKIREYVTNHFVADTVVKTDVKSIVKAMEEGVSLGREECRPAEWSGEDEDMLKGIKQCVYDNIANIGTVLKVRYIDWLESLCPSKEAQQEQLKHYKDESLGSPDYERGFKHGRDYQTEITQKYTNKDKVIAYLVDKGYPVSTNGEIPTYQETFDMINNAIKYADNQEQPEKTLTFDGFVDKVGTWFAHLRLDKFRKTFDGEIFPATELVQEYDLFVQELSKQYSDNQEQPEVDLEKVLSGFTGHYAHENSGEYPSAIDIARHFYELGLKARKK